MSTLAYFDSKIISQINGAQSSRVPTPLLDDPYMAVRQEHLVDTDTESRPLEDLRETEIPQPLLVVPSPVPSSYDLNLTVGQAYTPAIIDTESELDEALSEIEEFLPLVSKAPLTDEEFEASEPSDTRITSSHSTASSYFTTLLSPDNPRTQTSPTHTLSRPLYYRKTARMAVHTQPTLSPGFSARLTEAMTLSPLSFHKRYRCSYETPSSSASPAPSSTLPIWKRYRGTSKLILDTETEEDKSKAKGVGSESEESKDEGPDSEGDEATPEGQQ
ncbi:hypothetical protein Tco_1413472 [Tanacetum coccineum]